MFNRCRASPGITSVCLQWVCGDVCRGVSPQIRPVPRLLRLQCSALHARQRVKALAEHSLQHIAGHAVQSAPAHVPCALLAWDPHRHSSNHSAAPSSLHRSRHSVLSARKTHGMKNTQHDSHIRSGTNTSRRARWRTCVAPAAALQAGIIGVSARNCGACPGARPLQSRLRPDQ